MAWFQLATKTQYNISLFLLYGYPLAKGPLSVQDPGLNKIQCVEFTKKGIGGLCIKQDIRLIYHIKCSNQQFVCFNLNEISYNPGRLHLNLVETSV